MNRRRAQLLVVTLLGLTCGRTEVLRYPIETKDEHVHSAFDAGADAGRDAGHDAGIDAGVDAGACVIEAHTLRGEGQAPIDILFVVDDSCSMTDDQQALADNSAAFFNDFRSHQADYRIGIITTTTVPGRHGAGRVGANYLSPATPNVQKVFTEMFVVGSGGSGIEQGLASAHDAFIEPSLTANRAFFRNEADLALVFLGDEDDQSNVIIPKFAQLLRTLKGQDAIITVASILGLKPSPQCDPQEVESWRLATFTRQFGNNGLLAICTDEYDSTLQKISGHLVAARCTVNLSEPIDFARGVRVTVNGTATTWRYHPGDAQLPFGSIELTPCPTGGGTVIIAYDDEHCTP